MTWMLDLYKEIGRPAKEVVQELLNEHSMSVASRIVGVSAHTLKKYAVQNGLKWTAYKQDPHRKPRPANIEYKNIKMLEYDGMRKTLREWGRYLGMHHTTLLARFDRGWSIEKTLSTPKMEARVNPLRTITGRYQSDHHPWKR